MTVHAGDSAIYTPRRGEPMRVVVSRRTAKRVVIVIRQGEGYRTARVKAERLEKVRGGGC